MEFCGGSRCGPSILQADVQLVVDVLEESYIAVDKGPITDTHALVVSVEHYPNTVTLQPRALSEVHSLIDALQRAYHSRNLQLVGFER
jgi:diadenosine tetraphosphate (Ap4A) HIT family hydrolase